jgi:hypothetical protein
LAPENADLQMFIYINSSVLDCMEAEDGGGHVEIAKLDC